MKTALLFLRRPALAAAALLALVAAPKPSNGAYILTFQQVGPNVVTTGSGSFNLSALTLVGTTAIQFVGTNPSSAYVSVGSGANSTIYRGATGPIGFGSDSGGTASSSLGNYTLLSGGSSIGVPSGYVSGAPLSGTATYNNATFSSLSFTPGTYVYTWGAGANADSFTITSVVPEPSVWACVAAGTGLLGVMALRRRRLALQ